MSADVSPETEQYIQTLITRGCFRSRGEVLDAGVNLLRMQTELLEQVDIGRDQLETGQYEDYDDASLRERFRQLKARAHEIAEHHE